jgi:hypothetical protein
LDYRSYKDFLMNFTYLHNEKLIFKLINIKYNQNIFQN